jgi:hypothetical protein
MNQVYFLVIDNEEGNDPCAARFSFSFGSDGHPDFVDTMTKSSARIRFFLQGINKLLKIFFEGRMTFGQPLKKFLKTGVEITL